MLPVAQTTMFDSSRQTIATENFILQRIYSRSLHWTVGCVVQLAYSIVQSGTAIRVTKSSRRRTARNLANCSTVVGVIHKLTVDEFVDNTCTLTTCCGEMVKLCISPQCRNYSHDLDRAHLSDTQSSQG